MTWDFAEANFLSESSASILTCASNVSECLLSWDYGAGGRPSVDLIDARCISSRSSLVWNTDPPYYDNIAYADLSDYFYIWHKNALHYIWPNLYRRLTTNKDEELTALAYRERQPNSVDHETWGTLDSKEKAELFFMTGIGDVFVNMRLLGDISFPAIVYLPLRLKQGGLLCS